ncbi:hypothetical protein PCANB_000879 [Pneumocystis canis]|nr:hypothetical protein PCANB_000879 [Pneumocystis canis]
MRNQSLRVPGGSMELTEGHHQEWSLRLNLTQHGETYQLFLDSMGGGAWPFLVGEVISRLAFADHRLLRGTVGMKPMEVCDALRCSGLHARYTDRASKFISLTERALQLLLFNEEFLVSASHQLALIMSLPFVHTARRYYRLNGLVRSSDRQWSLETMFRCWKVDQIWSFRGSKSRNKEALAARKVWVKIPSNIVKLRGVPKVLFTKQLWKRSCGRVNSPGYGNSNRNVTMDYPQPSPKESNQMAMGVVEKNLQCLRYGEPAEGSLPKKARFLFGISSSSSELFFCFGGGEFYSRQSLKFSLVLQLKIFIKLSTMDLLALASMKNVAKCDM